MIKLKKKVIKTKKNKWIIPTVISVIIILLLLILFTKVIPIPSFGNFSLFDFKMQFTAFGNEDLPDSEDKEQETDCTDLDIADEYRDFYGNVFINTARDSCNLNGVYQEDDDILGCSYDKDSYTIDCNTPSVDNLKNFCERLDATWICGNGFVGCVCERSAPDINCWWQKIDEINMVLGAGTNIVWFEDLPKGKYRFDWNYDLNLNTDIIEDPTGDDDNMWSYDDEDSGSHTFTEDETTDEWGIQVENIWRSNSEITITLYQWVCEGDNLNWGCGLFDEPDYWSGEQIEYTCGQGADETICGGTCPSDYYCSEVYFSFYTYACTCVNSESEVHPDWKEDGVYHNPQDESPVQEYTTCDEACEGITSPIYQAGKAMSELRIPYDCSASAVSYCEAVGGAVRSTPYTYFDLDCCCWQCAIWE